MSHRKPARAGLFGRAYLTLLASVRHPADSDLVGGAAFAVSPHRPSRLSGAVLETTSRLTASNEEYLLDGPLVGSIGHRKGLPFLFDNRYEATVEGGGSGEFAGITIRSDGVVVKSNALDLGFSGPDKSVTVDGDRVTVRVPPLLFNPSFSVRFQGGPFANQGVAEKGYEALAIAISWASNDAAEIPIQAYDQLTLDGNPIALDVGASNQTGGVYRPEGPLTEAAAGAGVSVRLHSSVASITRTARLNWHYRIHFGNSIADVLDEADIKALTSSRLQASRTGTVSFPAEVATYKWVCYPVAYGRADPANQFVDTSTNLTVPMAEPIVVSITNAYGHTADYYAYRTINRINGALNVRVD